MNNLAVIKMIKSGLNIWFSGYGRSVVNGIKGQWITRGGRLAMPVYHPSALLRNPALKRDTWEDLKKIVLKYRKIVNPSHYSAHI